ncbi:MAG: SprB repeat-containing protein, partial [Saprospiraceae bacterium]
MHTAFGPPYFIVINNNAAAYDLGTVTQLSFTFCSSKMLSAYLDRVGSARFYYRIYLESQQGNPPPYSFVNLNSNPNNNIDPNTCYTSRQNNTWDAPLSINVLNGLGSGSYLIDFYMEAQLDDVGDESMGCPVNAPAQCSIPDPHYGRVLRSRFNTTDPSACNYSAIVAGQAPATRMKFYTGNQPPPLSLSSSATNVSCFGGNNGTASVSVSGGATPYSYLWNNGQNASNISGLAAGTYTVTVTDATNSTATASATVSQPSVLSPNSSGVNISCFGGANGAVNTSASGGSPPYTYLWTNGQTTSNISGLTSGSYTVTVTDSKSCTKTSTTILTQPTLLVANMSGVNISCFGGANGTATASVSGGSAPYTYLWNNGQTSASLTGLGTGTYSVTVTDSKSCTKTGSVTITQPTLLVVNTSGTNVSCFGGTNGTATANVSGGSAPYTYLWNNGQSSASLTGLAAGTYNVTVTDANNCT